MTLTSDHSRVDQVRTLLFELQNSFTQLPVESQNRVLKELDGIAVELRQWIQAKNGQAGPGPFEREPVVREPGDPATIGQTELVALMDAVPAIIWISRDAECKNMVGNRYGNEYLRMGKDANLSKSAPAGEPVQQPYRNFKDGREIPGNELPMQIASSTGVGATNYEFDLVFDNGVTINVLGNVIPLFDPGGRPSGAVGAFVDISKRKRIEEELRRSEAQLRKWKDQINIWSRATNSFFWSLNQDGSYRQAGVVEPYVSGKPFEQTQGWKWIDIIHPDDRDTLKNQWQIAIREQTEINTEARIWHAASQQYRWYAHQAVPIMEDGQLAEWVGVSIDIQTRKEMEQALIDNEIALLMSESRERARAEELDAIMDAIPTPVLLTRDPEGEVVTGNRATNRILGTRPGDNLAGILTGELPSRIKRVIKDGTDLRPDKMPLNTAMRTRKPVEDFEATLVFKGGKELHLMGNSTPLLNDQGKPIGAVGVFLDITGRIATERALRESEHRIRVVLSSAPLVVYTLDEQLRYTWINNPRHNMDPNQVVGKRDDELNTHENAVVLMELNRSVLETGQPVQREVNLKVDGETIAYMIALDPMLDEHGKVTGLVGAALDVTDYRRLEAAHRENELQVEIQRHLLDTRENERVKIAREIHDGPIQTIVSSVFNLQAAKDAADQALKAELEPIGASLKYALRELRHLVNDLRPPILTRFGLVRAVERLADEIQEKNAGLKIDLDLDPGAGQISEQVSLPLYRICQEALNNIVRHSRATRAGIDIALDGDQVILRIRDDGAGFPNSDDIVRLIEENHFGLAGMKERAEAVGGKFNIVSIPGRGTTIEVSAPMKIILPPP